MNNSLNNANSGRPAEAPTARGFNPMPPPQNLSRAESSRGRGRHPSRSRTPNPSYVPRRQPQEPQLPVTFVGGRQLPNSEAELAAYGNGNYIDSNPDADPDASACRTCCSNNGNNNNLATSKPNPGKPQWASQSKYGPPDQSKFGPSDQQYLGPSG
jgi:hypothetical protein